jgi:hypothetical protein
VKGKNTMLWVVLAVVGGCGGCSLLTGAVLLLGLFSTDTTASSRVLPTASVRELIPRGETPDLFPGSPGWLPSGRGVVMPRAQVVNARPEGLWWRFDGQGRAQIILFLEDGTRATNPRPGGGVLFDREGQRAQRGTTGLGTFEVSEGMISQHHDGFDSTDALTSGIDDGGEWISIGQAKYVPLEFVSADEVVGSWKAAGSQYVFHDDGTFESGQLVNATEFAAGASLKGSWELEGYLISLKPMGAPGWISTIGRSGPLLVLNTSVYSGVE